MTIPEKAPRMQNTKPSLGAVMTGVIVLLIYAAVFLLEQIIPPTSMLFTVLKKGATYALVAVSMNLLNGFTGLFSLGQAGFMLIGAYTYAILTIPVESRAVVYQYYDGGLIQFAMPVIPALILAGLMAAAFAFLIGLPVLRLKSDYLAIATLGFAEIIRSIFQWDKLGAVTNGSNMLRLFPTFNDFNIRNAEGEVTLYLSTTIPFLIAGVCIGLIVLLLHSSYGRAFMSIRDDEIAAEAMGVNLARHKRQAFCISSFFAGVGGALLAMFQNNVASAAFTTNMTYEILLIVVIGGIGSLSGSIMGSFIFIGLNEWLLRGLDQGKWLGIESSLMHAGFRKVVFAVMIMLVVLFFSKGIMGNRELSWDGIARFFRTLPQRLKAWPAKQRQKRAERKAEREAKKAARAAAAQKKAHGEEAMKAGKPLFTPLPVYDHVVVFEKEGK